MSNLFFQFKKFTVWHDKCAMKVGTDGVLLGAWAPVDGCSRVLDVGAGSGLISLQLAQRNEEVRITAVEVDPAASEQARENVARSPWHERIDVVCQDFNSFVADVGYDLVVSNPPYFVDALKCPDRQRNLARHSDGLTYESLFRHSARLLNPEGQVAVIVPSEVEQVVVDAAWQSRLYPSRRLRVFTKAGKPCRRVLLLFTFRLGLCAEEELCIETASGQFTPGYVALTRDFYLKM